MFKDKLKNLISKEGVQQGNKKIENLVFLVIILIITIVIINFILNDKKQANKTENAVSYKQLAEESTVEDSNTEDNLEERLEEILGKIQGVGDVKVFINYSESSQIVAMYNENSKISTTEETDTSGGNRKIQETDTQKDIIYQEDDGVKTPITQKVISPKIEGAIITAKGASDVNIKTNIIQAVEAVTGLATHKIQVFEMQ